jgi:hypothetical protein
MSRNLSTANEAATLGDVAHIAIFAELDFSGGAVQVWTGTGNITTLGRTFTGLGDLAGISTVEETGEVAPTNLSLELSGVPSAMISRVLSENIRGRRVRLWLGFFTEGTLATLVDTPIPLWVGRMDPPVIKDNGSTATITVNCESRLVDLRRPRTRRYTHEEQQRRYPGDMFFQYTAGLAERPIYFGVPTKAGSPSYG